MLPETPFCVSGLSSSPFPLQRMGFCGIFCNVFIFIVIPKVNHICVFVVPTFSYVTDEFLLFGFVVVLVFDPLGSPG